MKWFIGHFCDHHDIQDDFVNDKGKFKSVELGCFPTKDCSHNYGLFYQGHRPAIKTFLPALLKHVELLTDALGLDGYNLKTLVEELKESLLLV